MKTPFLLHARALLVAAVLPLVTAVAAESPSLLLQKGIYAEEIERNLDSAIKIYEQIAVESAANRTVVAQAQYRLAVCYQKQGKKEQAIKLLNELVQQSPTDPAVSKKAREILLELGERPSAILAVRKVKMPITSEWFWPVSADGRYIPCQTADLVVCEIATGKTWTIKQGPFTKPNQPDNVVISPAGQWIAYDFSNSSIHLAKIDASEARKLVEATNSDEVISLQGWSPDGSQLFFDVSSKSDQKSRSREFALDVKTGAKHELSRAHSTDRTPSQWTASTSFEFVARRRNNYPRKITIVNLVSGAEETIVDHDADQVIGWAPDDTALLFTKRSERGVDLWSIGLKDGKPIGDAELAYSNFGERRSLGVTRDGTVFYSDIRTKGAPKDLWAIDGILSWKAPRPVDFNLEIPPSEILGSNNTILDRKYGCSATLPERWEIRAAFRLKTGASVLQLAVPELPDAIARLHYHIVVPSGEVLPAGQGWLDLKAAGPEPKTSAETDLWLRRFAEIVAQSSQKILGNGYENRAGTLVSRTLNGRQALTWIADFTKNEKRWVDYVTFIYDKHGSVDFRFQVPVENFDAVRPAWDRFVESLRLP